MVWLPLRLAAFVLRVIIPTYNSRSLQEEEMSERGKPEIAGKLPALVDQQHGGAIYAGGVPGHRGGPGRPPSALRERLRGSFEDRVNVLEGIADNPEADPQDRIRALDVLAKYGLGT